MMIEIRQDVGCLDVLPTLPYVPLGILKNGDKI